MERFENEVLYIVNTLQPHEWLMILAGVIVIGAFCMKGMSNKSNF